MQLTILHGVTVAKYLLQPDIYFGLLSRPDSSCETRRVLHLSVIDAGHQNTKWRRRFFALKVGLEDILSQDPRMQAKTQPITRRYTA